MCCAFLYNIVILPLAKWQIWNPFLSLTGDPSSCFCFEIGQESMSKGRVLRIYNRKWFRQNFSGFFHSTLANRFRKFLFIFEKGLNANLKKVDTRDHLLDGR